MKYHYYKDNECQSFDEVQSDLQPCQVFIGKGLTGQEFSQEIVNNFSQFMIDNFSILGTLAIGLAVNFFIKGLGK